LATIHGRYRVAAAHASANLPRTLGRQGRSGANDRRGGAGKKKQAPIAPAFYGLDVCLAELQGDDVLSLRPFLAVCFGKADALPFNQGFEPLAQDRTEMHEQVGTILALNKPKSFGFVEPFYGSGLLL
jgi:hypothetical protein